MKMKYTDEATFLTEEVDVPDDLYKTAVDLYKENGHGALLLRDDKKSLSFLMNDATNYYRVTVEKLEWR